MRTSALVLLSAIFSAASCLAAEPAAKTDAATALTAFSWDHVPLNIHFGKRNADLTDAEIDFLATHSRLIALEKGHGAGVHGSTEAGVVDTARRLKQRNPAVKVLFYLNAFINWPSYESFKTYRPEWTLRARWRNRQARLRHSPAGPIERRVSRMVVERGGGRTEARTD